MKKFALLITLLVSSYFSLAQDTSVFSWSVKKMDSVVRKANHIVDTLMERGGTGVVNYKYYVERTNNLIGIVYTYQHNKMICITTIFVSNQDFVNAVQQGVNSDKDVKVLSTTEYEIVIYNKELKVYTLLSIDKVKRLMYMIHSIKNPLQNKLVKST